MSLTKRSDGIELQTPAIDKLASIPDREREVVQEFLDWMVEEKAWFIGHYPIFEDGNGGTYESDDLYKVPLSAERIMALFFEIDLEAIDLEKRALLDKIRQCNAEDEAAKPWEALFSRQKSDTKGETR